MPRSALLPVIGKCDESANGRQHYFHDEAARNYEIHKEKSAAIGSCKSLKLLGKGSATVLRITINSSLSRS